MTDKPGLVEIAMTCSTCNERVIPVEGVTSVRIGEYDWHWLCVELDSAGRLARFPSKGKLIPDTIMEIR